MARFFRNGIGSLCKQILHKSTECVVGFELTQLSVDEAGGDTYTGVTLKSSSVTFAVA